jgi:hypothetical protein
MMKDGVQLFPRNNAYLCQGQTHDPKLRQRFLRHLETGAYVARL